MKDGCGRDIDYLRISLTDKCNLRCGYCMPKEGIRHLSHDDILSLEEIYRTASLMVQLGISRIRLTGGEPLIRKGVTDLVKMLSLIRDSAASLKEIVMTTNGCRLSDMAKPLKAAGLSGVNISLDTLDKNVFMRLTGSGGLDDVLAGIRSAACAGLKVKLNCVPVKGINDEEIISLARFAEEEGVDIRFIELMPLGCGALYEGIPSGIVMKNLEKSLGHAEREEDADTNGKALTGPAEYYRFSGYTGRIGFISPMSHGFCGRCNRIRLTAEGFLKLCLQYPYGIDLKELLRNGSSDDEIKESIADSLRKKPTSHSFGNTGSADLRKMVQIGG